MYAQSPPLVLLLGAKSRYKPLAAIPKELSHLKDIINDERKYPLDFELDYEPYFTHDQLKTKLSKLVDRLAILHFAGHSDGSRLLTDDKAVYSHQIANIFMTWSKPPGLVFLNGCNTAAQVKLFHKAGVPLVIATKRRVDDELAAEFAAAFYSNIFSKSDLISIQTAFDRASSQTLLSEPDKARSIDLESYESDEDAEWDWSLFPAVPENVNQNIYLLLCQHSQDNINGLYDKSPNSSKTEIIRYRSWVWRCNEESLANSQISILSILESICALGLYYFLAQYFQHHWWLLLSALAGPILLLRSNRSVEMGVRLLQNYSDREDKDVSRPEKTIILVLSALMGFLLCYWLSLQVLTDEGSWMSLFWHHALLGALVFVAVFATSITVIVASSSAGTVATFFIRSDKDADKEDYKQAFLKIYVAGIDSIDYMLDIFNIFVFSIISIMLLFLSLLNPFFTPSAVDILFLFLTFVAIYIAFFFAIAILKTIGFLVFDEIVDNGANILTLAFAGSSTGVFVFFFYYLNHESAAATAFNPLGFMVGVTIVYAVFFLILLAEVVTDTSFKIQEYFFTILFTPFLGLGIWLRSLSIRIYASLRYPITGLRDLPLNWHRINWCLDFTFPPELLPQASKVSNQFSSKSLLSKIKESPIEDKIFAFVLMPIWYIPAFLWRWGLKATLWLWWPLALLLKQPFDADNLFRIRNSTVNIVSGLWKWLFVVVAVVVPWLLSAYHPEIRNLVGILPDQISRPFENLVGYAVPAPYSLRYAAIWLASILSLVVLLKANQMKIHFPMLIGDETYVNQIENDPQYWQQKRYFYQRAKSISKWHTARIVSFILLGYSYILYLANRHYPDEAGRFIADWLVPFL